MILALLVCAAAACKSTDAKLMTSDGDLVAELEPAPYCVAIAPLEIDPETAKALTTSEWSLATSDPAALRERFLAAADTIGLASQVLVAKDPNDRNWLEENQVDLLIQPRIVQCQFDYDGSGRLGASLGLWITTWIGSLWVEDSRYAAALVMECALTDTSARGGASQSITTQSGETSLTFWERNKAFSLNFFATMILPPFLTSDDSELANESLTQRSLLQAAAELKQALLASGEDVGGASSIAVLSPRNGSAVAADSVALDCRLSGSGPFAVQVFVNGNPVSLGNMEIVPDVGEGATVVGAAATLHRLTGQVTGLRPAREDLVRLFVEDNDGRRSARTLILH